MSFPSNIKLIILFGSQATGKSGTHSDTDVAILSDHPLGMEEKTQAGIEIARDLGISEDTIDAIDLWDAPPLLQYQIAHQGKLLHGSPFDFLRFQVLAWKRYQDTAKFRRARERVLAHRYGNGK